MPIGNPINFIDNVESKVERYTATSNQTNFTVSSGYLIGQISVYRNGVRLVSGEDYDAINGSTVILKSGASAGDSIVFQIFDSFKVSNTVPADLGGTFANDITAPTFKGNIVGTAGTFTSGSFSGNLTVGGVLTYDDVTNVDSVGIITARTGLKVTSGGIVVTAGVSTFRELDQISVTGVSTFTGNVNVSATSILDVDGHTELDALNVAGVSTFAADVSIADKIVHTGDTNTAIRFPTDNTLSLDVNGAEKFRFISGGQILFSAPSYARTSTRTTRVDGTYLSSKAQLEDTSDHGISATRFTNDAVPGRLFLQKSRGTPTSPAIVQDGDSVGQIIFGAYDSNHWSNTAHIVSEVDGTPGQDDMPGALIFKTTADGAHVPTERLRIDSTGASTFSGKITTSSVDLSAISSTISKTATTLFVYDTTQDYDGGAWRKNTNQSWYNETLNTASRGSRKEFPTVAVIVGEANKVTIYDGDDPTIPMWMVFDGGATADMIHGLANSPPTGITMLNGKMCLSIDHAQGGLDIVDFIKEESWMVNESTAGPYRYTGNVSQRNDGSGIVVDQSFYEVILSRYANDVAMTALYDAPIDSETGLPIPTIAVATDSGVSVVKSDGTVIDTNDSSGSRQVKKLIIRGTTLTWYNHDNGTTQNIFDFASGAVDRYGDSGGVWRYDSGGKDATIENKSCVWDGTGTPYFAPVKDNDSKFYASNPGYWGGNPAFTMVHDGTDTTTNGSHNSVIGTRVAYASTDFNSGWLFGDCKGAWVTSNNSANNIGITSDRTQYANDISVSGTITKTVVATGADLVACSGFSGSNYMNGTITLNLGTSGTICYMGWMKQNGHGEYSYIVSTHGSSNNNGAGIAALTGTGVFYVYNGTNAVQSAKVVSDNLWHFCVGIIDGTAVIGYVDGVRVINYTSSTAPNLSDITTVAVGHFRSGSTRYYPHLGSLALVRVSASIPTADDVMNIYNDEKELFKPNAKCTVYGTSKVVTGMAYDDKTNLLHVGTSSGRSEFRGLNRINNTTTAVTTAISVYDGLVVEQ